jgi:MSHA pilin protein MshD
MPISPMPTHHQKAGFTLIELIITIIIMSFAAIIIIPYLSAVTHSPDPILREKAIALGQAMMDEILSKKWDENSPNGGGPIVTGETASGTRGTDGSLTATVPASLGPDTTDPSPYDENSTAADRTKWDDVDDYNGVDEPVVGVFYDQTGTSLPGTWTNFTRRVAVDYIASSEGNIDPLTSISGIATDTKRIIVTVTSPLGETFQFVGVSCNF